MHHPQLLADVGFTGDGPAVEQILNGTYEFPPDTEPYTKLILTEACALYCSLGEDGIVDLVKRQDFQDFWLHAREKTESSKFLLHFGHYCAAAHDKVVSQLHATSLNAIHACGVTPARWRGALTVLLEKVLGVQLVEKHRAICLLEADFNWLNKLIFTHRLEQYCQKHGLVPPEQFAKSKSSCEEASVVKNLVCDNARILHNSFAITSVDLDLCFDRSAGPIAEVAARTHKVSRQSIHLMLTTMQLMEYFIKSGFGIAKEQTFSGSATVRLMGLGQGSGAAPIGMRSMITLVDNAYKRLGHGMNAKYSLADRIVLLAAIIYVDDTDLLHWAKFYGVSDEAFMADIQRGVNDWGMLVQATGGSLEQSKSFWYLLSWKFVRGKPTIKSEAELPSQPLTIPLPIMARLSRLNENLSATLPKPWVFGTTLSMIQRLV
jgi:hypothetical protein